MTKHPSAYMRTTDWAVVAPDEAKREETWRPGADCRLGQHTAVQRVDVRPRHLPLAIAGLAAAVVGSVITRLCRNNAAPVTID